MNTSILSKSAATVAILASLLVTSSASAGPSPQYWQQQEKIRAENAAKTQPTGEQGRATACPNCKTSTVTEFSPTNVSGKWAPSYTPVGSKHECATCTGAITKVRGHVSDNMKANCPICAKAKADTGACCSLSK